LESKVDNEIGTLRLDMAKKLDNKADAKDVEIMKRGKADHEIIEQLI
jgi:hypothetical protein